MKLQAQAYSWEQVLPTLSHPDSAQVSALQLTAFPNPTHDRLVISYPTDMEHVAIFDQSGNILYYVRSGRTILKLDFSAYPSGTYWVMVRAKEGAMTWKQVRKV